MTARQSLRHIFGPHRLRTHSFGPWTEPRFRAAKFHRGNPGTFGFGVQVSVTLTRHKGISGSRDGWHYGWGKLGLWVRITTHRYKRSWSAHLTDPFRSEAEHWDTFGPKLNARVAERKAAKVSA